jgi:RimJ/RimL family protein N-acetyltransferase
VITLALRPIRLADTDRIHEWVSLERVCRFQAWGPNTREQTDAFVAGAIHAWERMDGERLVWVAEAPTVGVVGMGGVERQSETGAEIGYSVHVDFWGRGWGTQIACGLTDLAFADAEVERVQGTCDPRNVASATVLRRAGLVYEGTLRHTVRLRDGWRDSEMYSILREEWEAHQDARVTG